MVLSSSIRVRSTTNKLLLVAVKIFTKLSWVYYFAFHALLTISDPLIASRTVLGSH